MDLIAEYNKKYEFFREIAGVAMKVHSKYRYGLLESAYEAALKYLLELQGHKVERHRDQGDGSLDPLRQSAVPTRSANKQKK